MEHLPWFRVYVSQTFSRKSLWLLFGVSRRPNQWKATWAPLIHGILPAYSTHFLWSISLYPSLRLALSLVVCRSLISKGPWEWGASNNSRQGFSVGLFGSQPIMPFSIWLTATGIAVPPSEAFIWLNLPIVKGGELKLGLSLTLFAWSCNSSKILLWICDNILTFGLWYKKKQKNSCEVIFFCNSSMSLWKFFV